MHSFRFSSYRVIRVTSLWPWLVAVICVAVPLATDPLGRRPFFPPKQALLVLGAAFTAVAVMFDLLAREWKAVDQADEAGSKTGLYHRFDPRLLIAVMLFWGWSVAAPIAFSVSPGLHLLGVIPLTAFVTIFLAAVHAATRDRIWRIRIAAALALSGGIVGLHALLQGIGHDPWSYLNFPVDKGLEGRWRVIATAGNPNWTAAYLACTAPLAAWMAHRAMILFCKALQKDQSGGHSAQFPSGGHLAQLCTWIPLGVAVMITGSRLGSLAMGAGAVFWWWSGNRGRRVSLSGRRSSPVLLLSGAACAALFLTTWFFHEETALHRWNHGGSIHGRLVHLAAAVHGSLEAPLAGNGLNSFAMTLPGTIPRAAAWLGPERHGWIPNAPLPHVPNELLEAATCSGLVSALLLAAVWSCALVNALRAAKTRNSGCVQKDAPPLETALGAMLVSLGILAMGWAPLQNPMTGLLFWIVVALLAVREEESSTSSRVDNRRNRSRMGVMRSFVGVAAALAVTAWAWGWAAQVVEANRSAAEARAALETGRPDIAERLYRNTLAMAPYDHESAVYLAGLLLEHSNHTEALSVLRQAARSGASLELSLLQAEALRASDDPDRAIMVLEAAAEAFPGSHRALYALGELYDEHGDLWEAIGTYERVISLPSSSSSADFWRNRALERLAPLTVWKK